MLCNYLQLTILSGGFVDEERKFLLLKCEVHESVLFVDRMAAEGVPQKYVPVRPPFLVHVLFDLPRNLSKKNVIFWRAYLNAVRGKIMRIQDRL